MWSAGQSITFDISEDVKLLSCMRFGPDTHFREKLQLRWYSFAVVFSAVVWATILMVFVF